jgi:hypothetical protein
MLTALAGDGTGGREVRCAPARLPGSPWSFRVAGAKSACPALELYEAGILLDVVTSTPIAAVLLRGGRAVRSADGPRAIAWGRVWPGPVPAVEFSRGRLRRVVYRATVIKVTDWCWLAAADGQFDSVSATAGGRGMRCALRRSRPCR